MAKRSTIGLCYFFDNQSNSGIVNYIYNIISALKTLPDKDKPRLKVFYSTNAPVDYLESIAYPFIEFILYREYPATVPVRKINSLVKKLFGIDLFRRWEYFRNLDGLYPYFAFANNGFHDFPNKIHWLVDFNNKAFPQHYEERYVNQMNNYHKEVTASSDRVVLSSHALLAELKQYYPDYRCDVRVMPFASSLPVLPEQLLPTLREQYQLADPYFMSPNQFWEHKNQAVVLEAMHHLLSKYPQVNFKVLFTGSLVVNRGKGLYADKLRCMISDFGLDAHVSFLGVLDRNTQLQLMKNARALLQPSLYEGWSTLVEEAKALNKYILLSDLPVHREQISSNVDFFEPHNALQLSELMYRHLKQPPETKPFDYNPSIIKFGKSASTNLACK